MPYGIDCDGKLGRISLLSCQKFSRANARSANPQLNLVDNHEKQLGSQGNSQISPAVYSCGYRGFLCALMDSIGI